MDADKIKQAARSMRAKFYYLTTDLDRAVVKLMWQEAVTSVYSFGDILELKKQMPKGVILTDFIFYHANQTLKK